MSSRYAPNATSFDPVSDSAYIALPAPSGICVQKSVHVIAAGLIHASNVNAFDRPATGRPTPAPLRENCRPAPNRPGAGPSLNAYAAIGSLVCAETVQKRNDAMHPKA